MLGYELYAKAYEEYAEEDSIDGPVTCPQRSSPEDALIGMIERRREMRVIESREALLAFL